MSRYEIPGWEDIPLNPEAQAQIEWLTGPDAEANSGELVEQAFYENGDGESADE